ncbi:hypothetical protein A2382_00080 [Candidatus Woesebacteria bacterium RIFOXYB1_FULL_38_16]|uniref:HicB-like antitoxin of toxin-antitoxin system domain-containing protein n=1 Tax=Candidatus Woesebacteria bacterium RIFOXYB1_FULL_38_16 TaxID=1802538 RepID=A0A1F8CTA3_9BACT|nr:MAG: hypothetical protein A2382_00080 [Candidatus Woesebacteria bacterium RIFOXYB1_FULL_38_16]
MNKIQFSLPVIVMKEANSFVAYSPALDLSTAAETFDKAKAAFEEAVSIFFEEIVDKGTVNEALEELGWQKVNKEYVPPMIVGQQNESFSVPAFQ